MSLAVWAEQVAPFAGAWIEIYINDKGIYGDHPSLPSRERGLKSDFMFKTAFTSAVAPFAGAWIEIQWISSMPIIDLVAPFAGAWIEITFKCFNH